MSHHTVDQIEAARMRVGVPLDFEYADCAAECGDIVFFAPGILQDHPKIKPVCSAECAQHLLMMTQERVL